MEFGQDRNLEMFLNRLAVFERWITGSAFVLLIVIVFADVAVRELTGAGLHWARQAGVYANIFVVMLGFGLASASGSHLRPRFADHWLPASWVTNSVSQKRQIDCARCCSLPDQRLHPAKRKNTAGRPV